MQEIAIGREIAPLQRGTFMGRPNRFIVHYRRGRTEGKAYLANPGRLGEILLPGVDLLLARRPHTKIGMEAIGATWRRRWPGDRPRTVFLNTGRVNDLAHRLLEGRRIPSLSRYEIEKREFTLGRSRFDFLLRSRRTRYLLEVKSVTLVEEGVALFPDATTIRGARHLLHLSEFSRKRGHRSGVLFLVQGHADRFLPDLHNDLEFARTFRSVRGKVDVHPYLLSPRLHRGRITFPGSPRRLLIPWKRLDGSIVDGGLYLLAMHLDRSVRIPVGSLGSIPFRKGHYVYIGSARRNLTKRIERHLRRRKRLHWHVDHLRDKCDPVKGFPVRGILGECELARDVAAIGSGTVEGFGSSDCGCPSHLVRFADPPHRTPTFQRLLTSIRSRGAAYGASGPSGAEASGDPAPPR
jgi:sugar fermentation stimulation protein A